MAFDFPDAPVANDIYDAPTGTRYIYTGVVWDRSSSGAAVSTVPEAPADGQAYNRRGDTQVWVLDEDALKVDLTGDTMTGALTLPGPPALINEAATKGYVDAAIASGSLYQGLWRVAANTPDLTPATMNPQNGWSWIAQTVDPAVPETAPVGLPGIGGQTIFNGDNIKWNTGLGVYERTQGSSLTAAEATTLFVDVTGDTMTGALVLASDPVVPLGAAPKQYVDVIANGRVAKAGDTMTGPLIQAADPVAPLGTATKQYVDTVAGNYVHLTGDTMVGPLDLPLNPGPVSPTSATTKDYVDRAIAANALYQGTWQVAANIPDLTAVTPLNGYSWLAQTVDPSIPELTTIALPGIPLGTSIDAGWTIRYNGGTTQFELIKGPDISLTTAQTMFVDIGGDTMTGPLLMAADPTAPLEVATKQYVDANAGLDRVAKAGDTMTGNLNFADDDEGVFFLGGSGVYKKSGTGIVVRENATGEQPQIEDNNGTNRRDILDAAGNQLIAGTDSFLTLSTRNGNAGPPGATAIMFGYGNQSTAGPMPTWRHEIRTSHAGNANDTMEFWINNGAGAGAAPNVNPFTISGAQLTCNKSVFIAPAANLTFGTQQAANPGDNSKHIQLYSSAPTIGINVTSGRINYNHNAAVDTHWFRTGNADRFGIADTITVNSPFNGFTSNGQVNVNANLVVGAAGTLYLYGPNSTNNTTSEVVEFRTQDGKAASALYVSKQGLTAGQNEGGMACAHTIGGWGGLSYRWHTNLDGGGNHTQFYVDNVCSAQSYVTRSDARLKDDIRYDIAEAVQAFDALKPTVYRNKPVTPHPEATWPEPEEKLRFGFVADDMFKDPLLARVGHEPYDKEGMRGYDIVQVLTITVAALKELKAELAELKKKQRND